MKTEDAYKEVLSRVDVVQEFQACGGRVKTGAKPAASGWLSIHSPYHEDTHASASLYCGHDYYRGMIVDHAYAADKPVKRSFWGWIVDLTSCMDKYDAMRRLAAKVGVQLHDSKPASEEDVTQFHLQLIENPDRVATLLAERGITIETAKRFMLGWNTRKKQWAIPIRNEVGNLLNIKFHGGGKKPSWFKSGLGTPLFGTQQLRESGDGDTVVFTEGEFDAILCAQVTGLVTASTTAGCGHWISETVNLCAKRHVVLCYDSDVEGQVYIERIVEHFRPALTAGEVLSLRNVKLYAVPDKARKDVTDFVVKDGRGAELLDTIRSAPLVPLEVVAPEELATKTLKLVDCDAFVDETRKITMLGGDKDEAVFANFILRIREEIEIIHQDGGSERAFRMGIDGDGWAREFEIDAGLFSDDRALRAAIGNSAGKLAGYRHDRIGDIRLAGQKASTNIRTSKRLQGFGILRDNKQHVYISPTVVVENGRVMRSEDYSDASISPRSGHKYASKLDLKMMPDVEAQDVLRRALEGIQQIYGIEIGAMLLGVVALSVAQDMDDVTGVLDSRVALWLIGASGSGKTEAALLAARFFGEFGKPDLPAWSDTANSIQMEMQQAVSAVFVADDWKNLGGARLEQAKRVMQAYNSGRARGRMDSKMRLSGNSPLRCQLIVTAESAPEGDSALLARGIQIDARKIRKLSSAWSELKSLSMKFGGVTPHLIAWTQRLGSEEVVARVNRAFVIFEAEANRTGLQDENLHRVCSNLALVYAGFSLFMDFVADWGVDAWHESRCKALLDEFMANLVVRLPETVEAVQTEKPAEVFITTIQAMVAAGRVRIMPLTIDGPDGGYKAASDVLNVVGYFLERANGAACYYILPTLAVKEMNEHLRRGGGDVSYSMKAIARGLAVSGLILKADSGTETTRIMVNHVRPRVWALTREAFSQLDPEELDRFWEGK